MLLTDLSDFIKQNRYAGRGKPFTLTDKELLDYLIWSFNNNYLIVASDENGISGVCICYALQNKFNNNIMNLVPSLERFTIEQEAILDICVMDMIYKTKKSTEFIVSKIWERFPNWEKQDKWMVRFDKPKQLTNHYMKTLKGIS